MLRLRRIRVVYGIIVVVVAAGLLACSDPVGYSPPDTGGDDTGNQEAGPGDAGSDADADADEDPDASDQDTGDADTEDADTSPGDPCEGRGLPDDWFRRTTGSDSCIHKQAQEGSGLDTDRDCRSIEGVWNHDWPIVGVTRVLTLGGRNGGKEYVAMAFNSGHIPADLIQQITVAEPQAGGLSPEIKMWSISRCPGDFNKAEIAIEMGEGCYKRDVVPVSDFAWGGSDAIPSSARCGLESHTEYYLNILYTRSEAGTLPDEIEPNPNCIDVACGNRLAD